MSSRPAANLEAPALQANGVDAGLESYFYPTAEQISLRFDPHFHQSTLCNRKLNLTPRGTDKRMEASRLDMRGFNIVRCDKDPK